MRSYISDDAERLLERYRCEGVLRDIDEHRLHGGCQSIIIHGCADGHQCPEILGHLGGVVECRHYFGSNGGALWLDPQFRDPFFTPLEMAVLRKWMVYQTCEALVLKETDRAGVLVHEPCGKAKLQAKDLDAVLDALVRGQRWTKLAIPEVRDHLILQPEVWSWAARIPERVHVPPLIQFARRDKKALTLWADDEHDRFDNIGEITETGLLLAA